MRRSQLSQVRPAIADPAHFTGSALRYDLVAADDPPSSAIVVRFEPGGRTHWHRHPNGQYLYVLDGEGRVQRRGADIEAIRPGDCIYAEPGEEHWHGASEEGSVSHLAFSFGVTEWLEPADK